MPASLASTTLKTSSSPSPPSGRSWTAWPPQSWRGPPRCSPTRRAARWRRRPRPPGSPAGAWKNVGTVQRSVSRELNADEEALGLPLTRPPDSGFVALAHGWAKGKDLATLLAPADEALGTRSVAISAGDFVRNVKQLTDLLRQLGEVLPDEGSAESARRAAGALFRGVVAASSVIAAAEPGTD